MNKETSKKNQNQSSAGSMIRISDLHKWFGDFHVLRGIDLTVDKKETATQPADTKTTRSVLGTSFTHEWLCVTANAVATTP